MKLYLISQTVNTDYDTYDSAVVSAESEEEARNTKFCSIDSWTKPENVKVEYLGEASNEIIKSSVICSSFNAG